MGINEQRDSAEVSVTQGKGIQVQRNAAVLAAKKKTLPSLTTVLCDSLESYDQVLSCASKGKLHLCSVPELRSVLKVNGYQHFHHRKEYIEQNFSVLSGVLFQTRFSSLVTGDSVITPVALEDSEVLQDLAALQWLNGARNDLVLSSPEERTSSGERQSDCVSKVTLGGLEDDFVESAAAISSLKSSDLTNSPVEGSKDMVEFSADDCYRPDMSMVVMLESMQGVSSPSMSDQSGKSYSQEKFLMNGLVSKPEGRLLTEPSMAFFYSEKQLSHPLPPPGSYGNSGSSTQEVHVTEVGSHTSLTNAEISDAKAKIESEEEDMTEKLLPFVCLEDSSSIMYSSLPFVKKGVLKNNRTLALHIKNHMIFEQGNEQLVLPNYEEVSKAKEQSSYSSISSSDTVEEPAQPSPFILDSEHNAVANKEFCQAEVKSELKEKIHLVEKFAMEAVELNVLNSLFKEDELSDIQLLDEIASERNMHIVANVHDFIELEEDQSSNSSQIQELQLNSPACAIPSTKQTSSAEHNFVGFLGLLGIQIHLNALTAA